MSWTVDRVATLKKLWADGHSASAIATKLGEVTRNAVIGKVHRLGLAGRKCGARKLDSSRPASFFPPRRPARQSRRRSRTIPAASSPRAVTATTQLLPEPCPTPEHAATVLTLTAFTCRWPEGDPKREGFHFCGRTKGSASGPYCEHHAAIAFR